MTAVKDLIKVKVYMNELVALALLAAFVQQDYKTADLIGFFMLLSLIIEQNSAVGARASIEELVKLTPQTAQLLGKDGEVCEVKAFELKPDDVVLVRQVKTFQQMVSSRLVKLRSNKLRLREDLFQLTR